MAEYPREEEIYNNSGNESNKEQISDSDQQEYIIIKIDLVLMKNILVILFIMNLGNISLSLKIILQMIQFQLVVS